MALKWTHEMLTFMRGYIPGHTESEIRAAFSEKFGIGLTESQIGNTKVRLGVKSGTHGGQFVRGHATHNKGRRQSEWMTPEQIGRTCATRFSKGSEPRSGAAIPIGTERINRDGYIEVKVSRLSDRPCANTCWKMKHRLAWEGAHGQVPDGHIVVFLDGDRTNCEIGNLACISRTDALQINRRGLRYHDAESLQVALDIVHIGRAVQEKLRSGRDMKEAKNG